MARDSFGPSHLSLFWLRPSVGAELAVWRCVMLASYRPRALSSFRARAAARGVTRFELLLGLGAAAVAALVGVFVHVAEHGANPTQEAEKRGKIVLSAASDWKREHTQTGCPSITQLQRDEALDPTARAEDPLG